MKKYIFLLAALCGFFYAQNIHAICSNPASYSDGNVLTASSLNTNFGAVASCVDSVLNGDEFTGNMSWYSGADALFYSDTGSTLKASIDGATGAAIVGLTQAGQVTNCGISVSGSTFTINGYDGSALSATNPCVIAVRSNTAGRVALAHFTSNVTFTFGSTSDTDGNDWGITNTADWSNAMPFFIGVIYNGTTPYFTISRLPLIQSGSASTDLCQKGDTSCDDEKDVMILASGLTLSSFVDLPITQSGWFQMSYATSGSAWTASITTKSGFNLNFESIEWTMPAGQRGAGSGKYFSEALCTAPVFSINTAFYKINSAGFVTFAFRFTGDGGTDGSGVGSILLKAPYNSATVQSYSRGWAFYPAYSSGILLDVLYYSDPNIAFSRTSDTASTYLNCSDFTNGNRGIQGNITYLIDGF